jgi:hypothetical protein
MFFNIQPAYMTDLTIIIEGEKGMENQPDTNSFVPEYKDTMQSGYGATQQSRDFGDMRYFPDVAVLEDMYQQWNAELQNPERSPRSIKEINVLLGRLIFEIAYRNGTSHRETEMLENTFQSDAYTPATQQIFTIESAQHEQRAA